MVFVKLSYLLILIIASLQTVKAEPVKYENLPLGNKSSPLILRTYMPDPGLEEGYFAHHGKGEKSAKYNPGSGNDAKGEYLPIKGLPAAVGVNHGPSLSYAFDTVECRIAYAWQGGFMDMYPYWGDPKRGNRLSYNYVPHLVGILFYKANPMSEIYVDGKCLTDLPDPKYIGYDLKEVNPTFLFSRGGHDFSLSILPNTKQALSLDFTLSSPDVKTITYGKDLKNPKGSVLNYTITGTRIATYQGFPRDLKIKEATVANGQLLYDNLGCSACHSIDGSAGHGPTLSGLYDSERMIEESDKPIKADDSYILESIKTPGVKTAKGFPPNYMPPYQLSEPEYGSLNLFIKSVVKGE
jgi:mono/diheme cytochrome c family protein